MCGRVTIICFKSRFVATLPGRALACEMAVVIWQCLMQQAAGDFGEFWSDYPPNICQALEHRRDHRDTNKDPRVSWGGGHYIDIDTMEQVQTKIGERRTVRRVLLLREGPRFEDRRAVEATGTPTTDVPPHASRGTGASTQAPSFETAATPPLHVD